MIDDIVTLLGATITRVYPGLRPQGSALPAAVVNMTNRLPEYADDGEAGLAIAHVQIDSWGETYTAARDLSVQVFNVLSAYDSAGALEFVELVNERDLSESGSGQVEYLFRVSQDYRIVERI